MNFRVIDIETISPNPDDPYGALAVHKPQPPIISLWGMAEPGQVGQLWWPTAVELKSIAPEVFNGSPTKPKPIIVGWNIKYDLSVLFRHSSLWRAYAYSAAMQGRLLDGIDLLKRVEKMYGSRTWKVKHDLESACVRWGICDPWKADTKYDIPHGEMPKELEDYHARDLMNTHRLIEKLWAEADEVDRVGALRDGAIIPPFVDSQLAGWAVDQGRLNAAIDASQTSLDQTLQEVKARFGAHITEDLLRSDKQMQRLLYDELKFPIIGVTDSGAPSVDSETLTVLAMSYPELRYIVGWNKLDTRLGRQLLKARAALEYNGTGSVHPSPMLASTYTGRASYSGSYGKGKKQKYIAPPMHQIERGPEVRQIFVADPGRQIAEFDFAGQEMRILAWLSRDRAMIDAFRNNRDLHSMTTASIFAMKYDEIMAGKSSDPEIKRRRALGKEVNLASQYRMGWKTLQWRIAVKAGIRLSDYEAKMYRQGYLDTWPSVPLFWQQAIDAAKGCGFAETLGGRRVGGLFEDPEFLWSDEQTSINTPIQGTGADMKVAAITELLPLFASGKITLKLELHDGLFISVPDAATAMDVHHRLNQIDWCAWFGVDEVPLPIEIDGQIGTRWSELKPLETHK